MQEATEPAISTGAYPDLGTRIRIKSAVHHHQVFIPKGSAGCVIYTSQNNIIQVQFEQPIEDLGIWKNTITFFRKQGRDALTWFHYECEVIE